MAEAVTLGIPACSKMGSATFDSPEKAGPTMATTLSDTAFWASWGAWAGSPWLSYSTNDTWVAPDFLLCWSTASLTPSRSFMPSWGELGPVREPKKPILIPAALVAPPVVPPVVATFFLLLLQAPSTRATAANAAAPRHQAAR